MRRALRNDKAGKSAKEGTRVATKMAANAKRVEGIRMGMRMESGVWAECKVLRRSKLKQDCSSSSGGGGGRWLCSRT